MQIYVRFFESLYIQLNKFFRLELNDKESVLNKYGKTNDFSSSLYNLIIKTNNDEIFIFIADFNLVM